MKKNFYQKGISLLGSLLILAIGAGVLLVGVKYYKSLRKQEQPVEVAFQVGLSQCYSKR